MACLLAGTIAVPVGIWFAGRTEHPLAFIGAGILFLPLFIFLPRLVRYAMKADTDAASKNSCEFFSSSNCASRSSSDLDAFGKNEQTKKVFWTLFLATAGLVLAQVLDPVTAQKLAEILAGLVP